MRCISLLDCTLRDGGYVNDWNFGNGNAVCIFDRLCEANVDIIEIGFLDERREFDINRTIQPDTGSMSKVYADADGRGPMVVAMIDYGTCSIDKLQPCSESFIDGIRIIFKKAKVDGALAFAQKVKEKGYAVFLQMVSITSYADADLKQFIEKANEVDPYAVSIVDTYGLLDKKKLIHYFHVLDDGLNHNVRIGYHSHNNFQLAYSNSIELLEYDTDRDILIDGTLYGMGKSAGNAPLELLAMYLNQNYEKEYRISSILEAIDNNVMNIFRQRPWGYSYVYYIAASNDCHPNYVMFLLDKNTLSVKSVSEILSKIPPEKKLLYDSALIEDMYRAYQGTCIDDSDSLNRLKEIFADREILLIGPGRSITSEKSKVDKVVNCGPLVISVNSAPSTLYSLDYVFVTSSKRYNMEYGRFKEFADRIILTSNITPIGSGAAFTVNYNAIRGFCGTAVEDDSLILMLSLLQRIGCKNVFLAGFDGFTGDPQKDYYDTRMTLRNRGGAVDYNKAMAEAIQSFRNKLGIEFVTTTNYVI